MREFLELEINDDVTTQEPVVKDKVEEVVIAIESEALLPGLEEEAFAQFEQELFQVIQNGGFEVGLRVSRPVFQAEEFEDERFFEEVFRRRDDLPLAGEAFDPGLVAAQGEALVEAGGFLAFQFADIPARVGRLDFVKATFVRVFDAEQFDVMCSAHGKG